MITKDLTSQKFGRFTVTRFLFSKDRRNYWECICECGELRSISTNCLTTGNTQSCGCKRKTGIKKLPNSFRSRSNTYTTWKGMHKRCCQEGTQKSKRYKERGIVVCDRWQIYENFLEDMGLRPANMTLDRIDNDGNYEPKNCRWATPKQQSRNTCTNRVMTCFGESKTMIEWSEDSRCVVSYILLKARMRMNWDATDAITRKKKPNRRTGEVRNGSRVWGLA
jgi:hypothetical protein